MTKSTKFSLSQRIMFVRIPSPQFFFLTSSLFSVCLMNTENFPQRVFPVVFFGEKVFPKNKQAYDVVRSKVYVDLTIKFNEFPWKSYIMLKVKAFFTSSGKNVSGCDVNKVGRNEVEVGWVLLIVLMKNSFQNSQPWTWRIFLCLNLIIFE